MYPQLAVSGNHEPGFQVSQVHDSPMSHYEFVYGWLGRLIPRLRRVPVKTALALGAGTTTVVIGAIAVIFAWTFWATDKPTARIPTPAAAINATPSLMDMMIDGGLDDAKVDQALAPHRYRMEGISVLMVPSFLSDFLMPARNAGLTDYFSRQEEWLAEKGIQTYIAESNTAASAAQNAVWIAGYVETAPTPVCLITHSKGGVDVLTFLLSASEQQLSNVACWIALQPPFGGSPVADQVLANGDASSISAASLLILGGSLEAVHDLGTQRRQQVLAGNEQDIQQLVQRIPILSVAGRFSADTWLDAGFPYTIPQTWLEEHGYDNDGLVPVASAQLPHTPYVIIEAADHGATIRDATPLADDAGLFLKALFAVMFESYMSRQH